MGTSDHRDVLVSGYGWVTALGDEFDKTWLRLARGESGFAPCRTFNAEAFRNVMAAEALGYTETNAQMRLRALIRDALVKAVSAAGLNIGDLDNYGRVEIIVGCSFGGTLDNAETQTALDQPFRSLLAELRISAPLTVVSTACSSSSDAVAAAYDLIAQNEADIVIAGGADVLDIYKFSGHSSLSTLSPTLCRPFAKDADGMLMGEGAAFLVLEAANSATRRHCPRKLRLAGVAATTDTNTLTSPDEKGEGARRAVLTALARANRTPADVAYINAHGSGTPVNDAMEACVYAEIFAPYGTAISSTKSAFGHTLGATGAIESIVTLEALLRRAAPPTALTETPSEVWGQGGLVLGATRQLGPEDTGVSVTYGFGGANVALAFVREVGNF